MCSGADEDKISDHAVIKLHRQNVLEKIPPYRRFEEQTAGSRYQRAVNQRPGVVGVAGAQPRDQSTKVDLRQHENKKTQRRRSGGGAGGKCWWIWATPRRPNERDIDNASEGEVRRQPILG